MGLRISTTIITPVNTIKLDNFTGIIPSEIVETNDLMPDDLHIGLYEGKIIINNVDLHKTLDGSLGLSIFDKSINSLFPNSQITHIIQYDTISMIGYVLINNNEKKRAKLYMEGQVCFDDNKHTAFEEDYLNQIISSLTKFIPKTIPLIKSKLEGKTINYKLKALCHTFGKLTKTENKYINGSLDEEFIHLMFQHTLNDNWSKLEKIKYIKFNGVNYNNLNFEFEKYILSALKLLNQKN